VSVVDKVDSLVSHEVETTLYDALVELGVRDTVHEETSEAVVSVVNGYRVTSFVELIGSGETSGTRSDNGNLLASSVLRRTGCHPACRARKMSQRFSARD
jgi:hypothetical protein